MGHRAECNTRPAEVQLVGFCAATLVGCVSNMPTPEVVCPLSKHYIDP